MSNSNNKKGMGILGVLQLIFIVLKLCKLIDWSWWAVLTPLWIDLGILALLVILYMLA